MKVHGHDLSALIDISVIATIIDIAKGHVNSCAQIDSKHAYWC